MSMIGFSAPTGSEAENNWTSGLWREWNMVSETPLARLVVTFLLAILSSTLLATAMALASRSQGGPGARERCELSEGIWHDSAGHGSEAAPCMGGAK
jgi:hypothetical protein